MAEEIRHPDGRIEHPTVRFEHTDASFPWIFGIIVAAGILGILIHWAVWLFFADTRADLDQARRSPYPLAPRPAIELPPEPRLEQLDRLTENTESNVYVQQKLREVRLSRYGPTGEKGYVHVPIEQAMQYLATRKKLRSRTEKAESIPRDNGLVGGGEPNSGRMFNRRKPRWLER
jgi:hypothetical protein